MRADVDRGNDEHSSSSEDETSGIFSLNWLRGAYGRLIVFSSSELEESDADADAAAEYVLLADVALLS